MSMTRPSRGPAPSASGSSRKNEYFVPRDGIDREVISADICRYLGNDALVRPGSYEDPGTRQMIQGYYINAYRNLTTAMIDDLKTDSMRWDHERRAQSSRSSGPGVPYHQSETHQSRQQYGPSSDGQFSSGSYGGSGYDPRYQGAGSQGGYGQHQQPQFPPGSGSGYSGHQQPPPGSTGFPTGPGGSMNFPPGQEPYEHQTVFNNNANPRQVHDPYGSSRGGGVSSAGPPQPVYTTAPPTQGSYPPSYQYPPQAQQPSGHAGVQSPDGFYRGPSHPPQQPAFSQQVTGQVQYDDPRASVPSHSKAQTPPAGSSGRRNDRDSDRHHRAGRR